MTMTGLEADTATAYRRFATNEARGNSPIYEAICQRIADDDARRVTRRRRRNPRHPLRDAVCGYEPPSRVRDDVRRTRSMIERGLTQI